MEQFSRYGVSAEKGVPDIMRNQYLQNGNASEEEPSQFNRICRHGEWDLNNQCVCHPGYITDFSGSSKDSDFALCDSRIISGEGVSHPFYKSKPFIIVLIIVGIVLFVICCSICSLIRRCKRSREERLHMNSTPEDVSLAANTLAPAPVPIPHYLSGYNTSLYDPIMNTNYWIPAPVQRQLEMIAIQAQPPQSELQHSELFYGSAWQSNSNGIDNNRYTYMNADSRGNPGMHTELAAVCHSNESISVSVDNQAEEENATRT